jgi:hypothetical protein
MKNNIIPTVFFACVLITVARNNNVLPFVGSDTDFTLSIDNSSPIESSQTSPPDNIAMVPKETTQESGPQPVVPIPETLEVKPTSIAPAPEKIIDEYQNNNIPPPSIASNKPVITTTPLPLEEISKESAINGNHPANRIAILNTSNGQLQGYQSDSSPKSLASIVKVFIALAVLDDIKNGLYALDSPALIADDFPKNNGAYGKTVKANLEYMLGPSSNMATNILIDTAGGFSEVNKKLGKYGINNTQIQSYLSFKRGGISQGNNISNMRDLVIAVDTLRKDASEAAMLMKQAMMDSAYQYNHEGRVWNKTGLNADVLGDAGVMTVKGVLYVYAVTADCPDRRCAKYDSVTETPKGTTPTNQIDDKRDPISRVLQLVVNHLENGEQVVGDK